MIRTALLVLAISCVAVAAEEPKAKGDGLAGASVLDELVRKQKQAGTGRQEQAPALKPGPDTVPAEDEKPLSADVTPELNDVLDRMEKAREGVQSLECDLIKHKRVPLFEIDDEFRGALRFRLPRFVRMELKGPVRRGGEAKEEPPLTVTVVNDDFAFIWRVADKQAERFRLPAIKDKRFSERNPLEYGLAAPVRNLERDYYLDLRGLEEVEGRPLLKIAAGPRPHVADAPFRRLYFWVDRETWLPVRYRHVKSDGEVIETYTLRNPRFNVAWKDDPFGPPPRDVQLIAHDLEEPRR